MNTAWRSDLKRGAVCLAFHAIDLAAPRITFLDMQTEAAKLLSIVLREYPVEGSRP